MSHRSQPNNSDPIAGLGPNSANILVYLPHRPHSDCLENLHCIRPAVKGEIHTIVSDTGNHWRKIFNIAAKLGVAFSESPRLAWQVYRDDFLCQEVSSVALLFGAQELLQTERDVVHVISGHTYCADLFMAAQEDDAPQFDSIDDDFRLASREKVIDCPYFDYRQLSNVKLDRLISLIHQLS